MYHLIQKNCFRDENYHKLEQVCKKFGIEHQIVDIVPFTETILYEPFQAETVWAWGSIKLANFIQNYGWKPGSMMNINHDFSVYSKEWRELLLNYDSQIIQFGDMSFKEPGYLFFARPCLDRKWFTGQVFTRESWNEFVEWNLTNGHTTTLNKESLIQISAIKDIQSEIRHWFVGGELITSSYYRINEQIKSVECNDLSILDFAKSCAKIWQPAEAFVLDTCISNGEQRIVEINCINAAGFYDCNMQKLIEAIHFYPFE